MSLCKKASLLSLVVILGNLGVGCSKKDVQLNTELDAQTVKANTPMMLHSEVAEEIQAREDMIEIYEDIRNNEDTEILKNFFKGLSKEDQDRIKEYANIQGVNMRVVEKEGNREYMNEMFEEQINTLLKHMYFLPEGYETQRVGTSKFKELNIEKTMNDYLKSNNIIVNEVSQVKGIDIDYSSLPFKTNITYTVKGEFNKKPFDEVITQEVYISPEDSEVSTVDAYDVTLSIDAILTFNE